MFFKLKPNSMDELTTEMGSESEFGATEPNISLSLS